MMTIKCINIRRVLIIALAILAQAAWAQPISGPAVSVFANPLGNPHEGRVEIPPSVLVDTNGVLTWNLDAPLNVLSLVDNQTIVATIYALAVSFQTSPTNSFVEFTFEVASHDDETSFLIQTGNLLIPTFQNPEGFGMADITLTDQAGDGAFMSQIIAVGVRNQNREGWSILFQDGLLAPPNGTNTLAMRRPSEPGTRELIPLSASSIGSGLLFTLSPNDSASGTVRFDIVPEPTTISFLAVGGLALWRLRRRRA